MYSVIFQCQGRLEVKVSEHVTVISFLLHALPLYNIYICTAGARTLKQGVHSLPLARHGCVGTVPIGFALLPMFVETIFYLRHSYFLFSSSNSS